MTAQGVLAGLFAIAFSMWGGLTDSWPLIVTGIIWAIVFTYHVLTDPR